MLQEMEHVANIVVPIWRRVGRVGHVLYQGKQEWVARRAGDHAIVDAAVAAA